MLENQYMLSLISGEKKTLSKISISELCEESGINRATFYKHYESPAMILREIAYDYDRQMSSIYEAKRNEGRNEEDRIEACMQFLLEKKAEIKILFSQNAEYSLSRFGLESGLVQRDENRKGPAS